MLGIERRKRIMDILSSSESPVPGRELANIFEVSRQVIVQDIALIRANGSDILSTNQGYVLMSSNECRRVFKVKHSEDQVHDELSTIIDCGGVVEDVFVFHRAYGIIKGEMDIRSRLDIDNFLENISSGKSSLLLKVTSGYHYHSVSAKSESVLNLIQERLEAKGYLAPLQEFEPIDFNKQ
ncbi:MAG: transcription repressor NadR [Firmicutes bacterium]|nr:transcription repressor NadR [Bacillota bacterium]